MDPEQQHSGVWTLGLSDVYRHHNRRADGGDKNNENGITVSQNFTSC